MPPSERVNSTAAFEPTAPEERDMTREETIREEDGANATPKDLRFWMVILGLLVATFLSALDLTGKSR
jgi:hypothetical protein